jgi:uncharacterized protein
MLPPTEGVPEQRIPAWGYEDLALFLGAVLPSLGIAAAIVGAGKRLAPNTFQSDGFTQLVFQTVFYVLLMAALWALLRVRYQVSFWKALGWTNDVPYPWAWLLLGPLLSIGVSSLAVLLKPPVSQSPLEDLIVDRRALILVVLLGPIVEELVFRGFLYPLLARSIGVWPAIFGTAVPFALLHGVQSEWAWQLLLPIGLAGVVFGWVRARTGSTSASALVHMSYNSMAVAVYLIQQKG